MACLEISIKCYKCESRFVFGGLLSLRDQGWMTIYIDNGHGSSLQTQLCPRCLPVLSIRRWCYQFKWRIGRISRFLYPGYGTCMNCKTTWNIVEGHSTQYSPSSGCFPLCESCWSELSAETRLPFYRRLCEQWDEPEKWPAIRAAVLEGK